MMSWLLDPEELNKASSNKGCGWRDITTKPCQAIAKAQARKIFEIFNKCAIDITFEYGESCIKSKALELSEWQQFIKELE